MTMANCSCNQCFKRVVFWFSFFFGLGRTGPRRSGPPGYAEFCGAVGSFGFVTCALFFHCFLFLGFSLCGYCFFCGSTLDSVGLDWACLGLCVLVAAVGVSCCLAFCPTFFPPSVTARTKRLKLVSLVLGFERVAARGACDLFLELVYAAWALLFLHEAWVLPYKFERYLLQHLRSYVLALSLIHISEPTRHA